ncbi:MAG: ATP-binding protein [Streptosporangiaceae bacterium]
MATVELAFSALPVHVRTARLIVTAVARRSGVEEPLLDEVRLAVGEACSRAVEAHQQFCPQEPVRLALTDGGGRFEVSVSDTSKSEPEPTLSMAVIKGLVDELSISSTPEGNTISMSWPAR